MPSPSRGDAVEVATRLGSASTSQFLRHYLRSEIPGMWLLAAIIGSNIAIVALYPQILRSFLDQATSGAPQSNLLLAAGAFLFAAVLQQVLAVAATYVGERIGWSATNALREDLALHCLRLDASFHKERTSGELIERVDGDVSTLSTFFSQFAIQILGNLLLLVVVLAILFREGILIGMSFTAFVVVGLAIQVWLRRSAIAAHTAMRGANADFYGELGEWLAGTEDIRSSGAEPFVLNQFRRSLPPWMRAKITSSWWGNSTWASTLALFAIGNGIAFAFGASLYGAGAISIGTVYLLFQYTEAIRRPMQDIRMMVEDFQRAGAGLARVQALLGRPSLLPDTGTRTLPPGPLAVELENVSFAYPDGPPGDLVLDHLSLNLPPGRTLGLLGRTGSGKTSLARLLVRFYDPQQGVIRIGNESVASVSLKDLRARVTLVTQDVQIFRATLRENLTFFENTVPDAAIWEALDAVGMYEWAAAASNGLDTLLEGGALSAGQAQLLAFARAFLVDPGLVILDEASSRLDPATERRVQASIDHLMENRTGIVIAHRLATIDRVDDVLILENGRAIEYGPRRTLERDPSSHLAQLLRTGEVAELLV